MEQPNNNWTDNRLKQPHSLEKQLGRARITIIETRNVLFPFTIRVAVGDVSPTTLDSHVETLEEAMVRAEAAAKFMIELVPK